MFLIDNILAAPMRGLMAVFREVHKAAEQASADEAEGLRAALSELYLALESGQISEDDFNVREAELLDRLDALENEA